METFHQKQQQPAHMFISVLRPKSHLKAEEKSMEIKKKLQKGDGQILLWIYSDFYLSMPIWNYISAIQDDVSLSLSYKSLPGLPIRVAGTVCSVTFGLIKKLVIAPTRAETSVLLIWPTCLWQIAAPDNWLCGVARRKYLPSLLPLIGIINLVWSASWCGPWMLSCFTLLACFTCCCVEADRPPSVTL